MRFKKKAMATSMQNVNAVALVVQEILARANRAPPWPQKWRPGATKGAAARGWYMRFKKNLMATSMQNLNAGALVV